MENLPKKVDINSDDARRIFFDNYYSQNLEFTANEVDAVFQYFQKRGFSEASAASVSGVLLQQAKLDGISVFSLLDTLKGLNEVQLSAVVTEVLNNYRSKISTIGYRQPPTTKPIEARNIAV